MTIPEADRDQHLAAKLSAEAPGILAWLVEGARRYLNQGLAPPEAIKAATAGYRQGEDTVGRFLTECVTFDQKARVPSG